VTDIPNLGEFDPATLYEAAGKHGMVDPDIRPAWAGARLFGPIVTVQCQPGDNLMMHVAVTVARPGDVLIASVGGYVMAGAWGEILTVAAQARGITGLALDGAARDMEAIAARRFPVFSRGLAIGSCTKEKVGAVNQPLDFGGVLVRPGDIAVGDTDGIVIVAREEAAQVYAAAVERRRREAQIMEALQQGATTMELLGLNAGGVQ
jgi:4-hydroxy-4-methyl-2-oxoglutarate aldolase